LYAIDLKGFSRKPTRGDVYKHNGRIACGSSCAPAGEEHSGTLGALVRRNDDPNRLFILSNNHVIASCNQTPIATHIMSPSNADYRPSGTPPVAIGQLSSIVELRSAHYSHVPPAFFDAALAEARPELLSSWQGDDISGYDTPSEIIRPFTGMAVKKFGRTTKLTNGIVTDKIALAKPIEYRHKTFSAICWFTDIWAVEPEKPGDAFSLPGDSGSLVVTSGNPSSVGIVFAGAKGLSYMIPLKELSEAMGFQLVSAHGC
jgi:hypothetical protein